MAKSDKPDVSALVAAQERLAQLNVEEAEIFIDVLDESIAKCGSIIDRYVDLDIRPRSIDQVINHREGLRNLKNHMCAIAGRSVAAPEVMPLGLPPLPVGA